MTIDTLAYAKELEAAGGVANRSSLKPLVRPAIERAAVYAF
jgi:hypothetical protein